MTYAGQLEYHIDRDIEGGGIMETTVEDVIDGLRIGLGSDDAHWSSIESAIRVLELVNELRNNIVGLSDADFEAMVTEAIKG